MNATASSTTPPGRGTRLALARSLWFVVVALAVCLYLFNLPYQLARTQTVCSGSACLYYQLSPADLIQLQQAGLSLGFYAVYLAVLGTVFFLVYLVAAGVIFWRRSDDWFGLFTSITLVLFGFTLLITLAASPPPLVDRFPALLVPSYLLTVAGNVCLFVVTYLFPDGHFAPGWIRWLVPLVIVYEAVSAFRPGQLGLVDWFIYVEVLSAIFAQIYRYRRVSDPIQRQQTKWVVFGSVLGSSLVLCVAVYIGVVYQNKLPGGVPVLIVITAVELSALLIPLSIVMAILRSRLWDIDILIRRTLVYGTLSGLLALVYLGVVVALQALFALLTGTRQSELVTVISTLVIAALFVRLRNRVQALIDRRFYRRKYDAARTLTQFGATLRDEVNLDDLSARLIAAVDETMQPESAELWLVKQDGQTPQFTNH